MDLGIVNVAAIVVLSYFLGEVVKRTPIDNKWVPVLCGACGLILGIVAFYIHMPDMPADDPITAAAIGVASGFAATGVNQIYKQFTKIESIDVDGDEEVG